MTDGFATWWLSPRDPLVFGTGSRTPALLPSGAGWMPPQATAAGMVRSTLAGGGTRVTEAEARRLLEVQIRGPWLVRDDGGQSPQAWVPIPEDATIARMDGADHVLRAELITPRVDEGVSQAAGERLPPGLFSLPDLESVGKTRRPSLPYRSLEWVVAWTLSDEPRRPWNDVDPPLVHENRIHVGIDDNRFTVEPEALFGSAGIRFAENFYLALEVRAPRPHGDSEPSGFPGVVLLGGEARTSSLVVRDATFFPSFESYRQVVDARIAELAGRDARLGLRLQLLSPGSFGGWRPDPWPEPLRALELQAAAVGGFDPVSGWNLQGGRSRRGAPRRVRRLVPAGSVYVLGPVATPEQLANLCESLWGTSLCAGLGGDAENFLAPPAHDGYGTVLPLPCELPAST